MLRQNERKQVGTRQSDRADGQSGERKVGDKKFWRCCQMRPRAGRGSGLTDAIVEQEQNTGFVWDKRHNARQAGAECRRPLLELGVVNLQRLLVSCRSRATTEDTHFGGPQRLWNVRADEIGQEMYFLAGPERKLVRVAVNWSTGDELMERTLPIMPVP